MKTDLELLRELFQAVINIEDNIANNDPAQADDYWVSGNVGNPLMKAVATRLERKL